MNLAGFQNRSIRPTLATLYFYILVVRMVGIEPTLRNRNWILSPTRLPIPPHSHYLVESKKLMFLKLEWNYNRLIIICQVFLKEILNFTVFINFNKI